MASPLRPGPPPCSQPNPPPPRPRASRGPKARTRPFAPPAGPPASAFVSLRGGMGSLIDALERMLGQKTVRCDSPVSIIQRIEHGWRAGTDEARVLILALPAHAAATLLAPVDAEAARLSAGVPYVSTATVVLAWPRTAIAPSLAGTGFVVARRPSRAPLTAAPW